jgi:citrate lyase gamma subunit
MGSRHEMRSRVRIGVVPDDKSAATIICSGCMELKTSNEMNHRLRKTGEVTITDKCMLCYRMQARVRSIRHRISHNSNITLNEALDLLDGAYE